jgi:hypothetical protein
MLVCNEDVVGTLTPGQVPLWYHLSTIHSFSKHLFQHRRDYPTILDRLISSVLEVGFSHTF